MKSIAVVYTSKYGTTKQYAQWIAEELNAPLFEASRTKPKKLMDYDVVVYGGGLYAGGIGGIKLVTKNACKALVVFTVGLANPDTTDYTQILQRNIEPDLLKKTKVFHLRGGIDYNGLGTVHKAMMAMLLRALTQKPKSELSEEDKALIETFGQKLDFSDRATVLPLVEYVRGM